MLHTPRMTGLFAEFGSDDDDGKPSTFLVELDCALLDSPIEATESIPTSPADSHSHLPVSIADRSSIPQPLEPHGAH